MMAMSKMTCVAIALVLAAPVAIAKAQVPAPAVPQPSSPGPTTTIYSIPVASPPSHQLHEARSNSQLHEAQQQLANAETAEEKQAAQQSLSAALAEHFDADIEKRREELVAIKNRVEKMEDLLQKRIENKESIVSLRLQVMLNEAAGLGWSNHRAAANRGPNPGNLNPYSSQGSSRAR